MMMPDLVWCTGIVFLRMECERHQREYAALNTRLLAAERSLQQVDPPQRVEAAKKEVMV